jgi:Fe-S-cluster-containing dehydrogenase component/formate-dependent nitrite reductase membrane component NrfD
MRYGFLIDQHRCIGCHACTVACKEEHNIPLAVNRTWVKYVEKGVYPDTRRHFAVLRCNHCDDAPCIEICPTVSLFRRQDGIVDFDHERCIGCKSCMQACPYDALYIDPDRNTAAKCNFDASRVEMGYKPACEVVCPTQAILSGDLDDPGSEISRRIGTEKTSVRKPEKATYTKLYYAGVEGDLLQPTRMAQQEEHFWAEKTPGEDLYALSGGGHGLPAAAREVYDVPHATPWGKKIASYLWTKSIAAGVLLISALLLNQGFEQEAPMLLVVSPLVALGFLLATFLLLVFDLKKPGRFFFLLTKPNLNSWLVLGGYVLAVYGIFAVLWLGQGVTEGAVGPLIFWPAALFGVASACYSAFLFAQARGRDFWQSPLLFWHLLVQAIISGAAVLILLGSVLGMSLTVFFWLGNLLVVSLLVSLGMILGELFMSHGSEEVIRSANLMIKGKLGKQFWGFVIGLGIVVPIVLILWPAGSLLLNMIAAALVLLGSWMYENLWIKAGQAVPLS